MDLRATPAHEALAPELVAASIETKTMVLCCLHERINKGRGEAANLALSCFYCNSFKGPNIAGVDPNQKGIYSP
jgi:hypothetical protein